jgi:SNF2 family DNA or RNA helicase
VLKLAQHDIMDFGLRHGRGNIWAGMGVGKTLAMSTLVSAMDLMTDVFPVLVIAPKRVATGVWPLEMVKWAHLRHMKVSVIVGSPVDREAALKAKADIYVINYDNLQWLEFKLGSKWFFRTVIADESTKLKGFRLNKGGARAASLGRFARATRRWYNLTGTPNGNGLHDLWGQQWFIDQGRRLGHSYTDFTTRWFQTDAYTREVVPTPWAENEIRGLLADCTIAIRTEDYFDLPDTIVNNVYVDLPGHVRAMYNQMEKNFFFDLINGSHVSAAISATKSMKLLQVANGIVFTTDPDTGEPTGKAEKLHDEKIQALREIVDEANGESVMVAYHFIPDRDRLLKEFPQAVFLDDNPKTQERWNKGQIRMLVAHPESAGHGLNLQDGGRILAMFGHWWRFEAYAQIVERIGPMRQLQSGHPRTVFIHNIVARDTVDEAVIARRDSHATLLQSLMGYKNESRR